MASSLRSWRPGGAGNPPAAARPAPGAAPAPRARPAAEPARRVAAAPAQAAGSAPPVPAERRAAPGQPVRVAAGPADGATRLNKRLAELGLCSRREADEWIERGWVRVNGEVAAMGTKVRPLDRVTVDRQADAAQARRVTILLHKPVGYVSGQAEDGHLPAVTLINARSHWRGDAARTRFAPAQLRGLAPAGRLDIDSVGLLVLTQDGRVARQLIGEDSDVDKEYLVRVAYGDVAQNVQAAFPPERLARLRHGLSLDGQALKPAQVDWQNPEQLRFVLREGKKRQIRRMCELVGLHVTGLKRVRIGRVALGQLPVGQWRYLSENEGF